MFYRESSRGRVWPGRAALVLALVPAAALEAADDKNVLLNRALKAAEQRLQACGPELHARFGVTAGSLRAITYAVGPDVRACRDSNTVALGKTGEALVVLCTPQFWRVAERDLEGAAEFLIHEYLHTRGLDEWPHGGKYDSLAITRLVRKTCPRTARP